MKIHLAFLCPHNNTGIGGGDRKYGIYYKNLDEDLFEKYIIYITKDRNDILLEGREVILTEDMLQNFLKEKHIEFVYFGGGKISKETEDSILMDCTGLVNVNFTTLYTKDPRKLNLIISMTDYWKLQWIHGVLSNSFVVYNPIDVELWKEKRKKTSEKYRGYFDSKKFIIGRMGRAEPSKWHYLILATLMKLDKEKDYSYGFLFAGLPWIYRKFISFFLSNEMQGCIKAIPEQRAHEDIAEFYASIDLFWQTSWIGESFGNVIVEAACFEVPTITDAKIFYKNGKVLRDLYDAQIEVVDHGRTGWYASYPESFIQNIRATTKKELSDSGKEALRKAENVYHILHTTSTLAKVLFTQGRQRGIYHENTNFESLTQNPSPEELQDYAVEYGKRIAIAEKIDTISRLKKTIYILQERAFRFIEYLYLMIRKWLKKYRNIDIETLP